MNINEIYLVVIKADKNNSFNGLGDVITEPFTNINVAEKYLETEYRKCQQLFIDSDGECHTVQDERKEGYFSINDGCDYYTGEIRPVALNRAVVYECK